MNEIVLQYMKSVESKLQRKFVAAVLPCTHILAAGGGRISSYNAEGNEVCEIESLFHIDRVVSSLPGGFVTRDTFV